VKSILSYTIVIIICIALGWFGHDWYQKKTMPEPDFNVQIDTVYQTITNKIIDTVKVMETVYIPKEIIKEVTKYDTVYFEKDQVQSKFSFHPEPFSIGALCYADCVVDSVDFSYYPNKGYFQELGMKFYTEGYITGQNNYPIWKKWAYFGFGVVGTTTAILLADKIK